MTTSKLPRSSFLQTLTITSLMRTAHNSRLDFWGPVALVVAFGLAGKFIQTLLAN